MRISDWSSDVCSSDLGLSGQEHPLALRDARRQRLPGKHLPHQDAPERLRPRQLPVRGKGQEPVVQGADEDRGAAQARDRGALPRPQPGGVTPSCGSGASRDAFASKVAACAAPTIKACKPRSSSSETPPPSARAPAAARSAPLRLPRSPRAAPKTGRPACGENECKYG